MKAIRPHFALLCVLILVPLLSSCHKSPRRDTLKIGIKRVTHVAVGQSIRLSAYQEYRQPPSGSDVAQAAATDTQIEAILPASWTVSDSGLATINADGTLTALKPGEVTVGAAWNSYETKTTVVAVKDLGFSSLPALSTQGTNCQPQDVALDLSTDRTLKFALSFADNRCHGVVLETAAPTKPFPWKFEIPGGTLELTSARGLIVSGEARVAGGQISFTVWSDGTGAYPVSLANKTVLLTGDSMSEGIGWSMKKKVEDAGGRLIVQPWYSSTTTGWQAERRLTEYIEKYHPDIIFIALGSNEIFTTDLEARAKAVKAITAEIGNRPAYWIGPPSWKPDKGIVRVIEENFREGHFYNSNSLVVPRRKDGAHPTVEGYVTWTELIWDWYARKG